MILRLPFERVFRSAEVAKHSTELHVIPFNPELLRRVCSKALEFDPEGTVRNCDVSA